MNKEIFKFKLTHGADLPESSNLTDSGSDLKAKGFCDLNYKKTYWFDEIKEKIFYLYSGKRVLIKTGIQIKFPEYTVNKKYKDYMIVWDAEVRPRSGLALKHGITVVNTPGTIDNGYTSDIGVILINHGDKPFVINDNDRIAQLVFMQRFKPTKKLFDIVDSFEETGRGNNGFGSTGL